jgi:hypothetical protein
MAELTDPMVPADKPECVITQTEDSGDILLTCVSTANPNIVNFGWKRGNETLTEFTTEGPLSHLRVGASEDNFGIYVCYVDNSIGAGVPCEADVQGKPEMSG